jgi:hypothetical protein
MNRKIHLLEKFLGLPSTPSAALSEMAISALEARYQELEQQYNLRFKQ